MLSFVINILFECVGKNHSNQWNKNSVYKKNRPFYELLGLLCLYYTGELKILTGKGVPGEHALPGEFGGNFRNCGSQYHCNRQGKFIFMEKIRHRAVQEGTEIC